MAADTTVEFGNDERRVRLIDRLFGDPETSPERRLSVPAVTCAVISVLLFAVAQAVPWFTMESITVGNSLEPAAQVISPAHKTSVEAAGDGAVVAYYLGIVLLFTIVGGALVSRPHTRRVLSAAGFGTAAGVLIVIIGLLSDAGRGGDLSVLYKINAVTETGPYVAIAAVFAAAAALALSGWHPRGPTRRRKVADPVVDEDDPDAEPGPIDLTVTSA